MEEELLRGGDGGGGGEGNGVSLLRLPTITTSLSLPLVRYTSRLISGENRQSFFRDYAEPRSDDGDLNCAYSKPIVVLDLIWNLAFVVVAVVVLLSTLRERPSTPLRVWLFGYTVQCLLHVGFVCVECRNRNRDEDYGIEDQLPPLPPSQSRSYIRIAKSLESVNTIISSLWWVLGFYWLVLGGQALLQDSPRLYWLTVVFLAFDVFYIVFCIGMACIIFIALFCCIPVVAIAYAVKVKEGASEDDIRALPKYRFCRKSSWGIFGNDNKKPNVVGARAELGISNSANELALPPDDSECCICLAHYNDGAELCSLPCSHHFHCGCISKWLRINATCPLCKFNILRGDSLI